MNVIYRLLGLAAAVALVACVPAPSDAHAGRLRASMVTTVADLAKRIDDPSLVLVHVGKREEYDAGHIRGAHYLGLDAISTPRGEGLILELPAVEKLRETFEGIGVTDSSHVVIYYGDDWVTPATRFYFTLDYLGLGDRASLLDGGMPAWKAAGHALTTDAPKARKGGFTPRVREEIVVDAAWVKEQLGRDRFHLVDARTTNFYDGSEKGVGKRLGHIAGAKSIPFTSLVDEPPVRLKPVDELRKILAAAGTDPHHAFVSYCHIGQQATLVYFVAKYLGYEPRLYDGSFQDWSEREELPVETSK